MKERIEKSNDHSKKKEDCLIESRLPHKDGGARKGVEDLNEDFRL